MDDAELLVELCTIDEVEAYVPTGMELDQGIYPPWCELMLSIKREADSKGRGDNGPGTWPLAARLPLRRHDGELIVQVINDVLHPEPCRNAIEGIWAELDAVVARIQRRVARGKEPLKRDVGEALGLATALAYLANPREPDVDDIRDQAMERFDGSKM